MKLNITFLFILYTSLSLGQNLEEIDALIKKELEAGKAPALAVLVIDSGKIAHLSSQGFRDLHNKVEANINTSFQIASVSKTVTNLAIFKLIESKKIDLNTDINQYLPFEVKNPHYPNDKITVGELLNHRSGIKDDYQLYGPFWSKPKGDPTIQLDVFLKDYLSESGALFKKSHFESDANYKSFAYSNTGVALLGLIVESVSGSSFETFCQENIFKPLSMNHTSWFLKNLDSKQVAKTYAYTDSLGFIFRGYNGYPDYPAGQLRTSIADFAKLLAGYLNADNGQFILSEQTINTITPSPSISQKGYYTWFMKAMNDRLYYSHGGGDVGVSTVVAIDVRNKNGVAIFANAGFNLDDLLKKIAKEMWGK